jgi:NAD(P)-dependent dehydrogenase (short-subunit alcohol dehydrogenase family)
MSAGLNWLAGQRALIAGAGEAIEVVAAALAAAGAAVARQPADSDAPAIAAHFDAAGDVDLLVHAGVPSVDVAPEAIDIATWRAGFSADIDSRFLYAAEFARRRIAAKQPGAILFLMPSPEPAARKAAAASAQGALDNLVKSLAVEWARDGIRVNAIASRACEAGGLGDDAVRRSLGYLAAYLESDYAAYVTGSVMGVDET